MSKPVHVVVLADTHIGHRSRRRLPDTAYRLLEGTDLILHAGDVVVGEVLDELAGFAPVWAVLGNNDRELVGVLPERRVSEVAGVRIAMVHDSGPAAGRERRLRRWFPDADVVVFGHSHIPWNDDGVDGQILFNPGSPTDRRRQPHHTLGRIDLRDGRIASRRIEVV